LVRDLDQRRRLHAQKVAIEYLDAVARELAVDKTIVWLPCLSWTSLSHRTSAEVFTRHGYDDRSNDALVIPLADRTRSELWDAVAKMTKRRISRARQSGVTIREWSAVDAITRYYPMHLETYRRTGARPHPRTYFETIFESPWSKVFVAEVNGDAIAAINLALWERRAAYWTGASYAPALALGANHLLQWHSIEWLHGAGFAAYAIGELPPRHVSAQADPKFHSLARYKSTFGPRRIPYVRAERVYRPEREWAIALYRKLKRR
jgi:lipid II:glycine glycyltransferase (peptidoglycan interpeptide bridge formation enzyme)